MQASKDAIGGRRRDKILAKFRGSSPFKKGKSGSAAGSVAGQETDVKQDGVHLQELSMHERPLSEALWAQAYVTLAAKEPDVVSDYEQYYHEQGHLGTRFEPASHMDGIIRQIYSDRKTRQLVVTLAGKSFKIREIGEKIVQFIWESKDLITTAASTEPHAALAWSGVSQLLPVRLTFPSCPLTL